MTIGGAPVKVEITGPRKDKVPVELNDHNDGKYSAKYSLKGTGAYTVAVTIDNNHVQGSPFTQNLQ